MLQFLHSDFCDQVENNFTSKYIRANHFTFDRSRREPKIRSTTPGPGSYQEFSVFTGGPYRNSRTRD
jgi:hypothetical protein